MRFGFSSEMSPSNSSIKSGTLSYGTGDSDKKLLLVEWTLTAKAPNANYGIFNLTA